MTASDPILVRVREALAETYGRRMERLVLFGSRARGEARPDSDYDVAVFLHGLDDRDAEVDRLARIQSEIIDDTGVFVHTLPFPAGAWREKTPLMHEIRSEGRDI